MVESIGKKVLKNKKDPELQKQLQDIQIDYDAKDDPKKPEADKPQTPEDDIQNLVKESKLQKRAAKIRKKRFNQGLMLIGACLFAYLVMWLFKPFEGDMRYGFCKVFLEQNVQYPSHMRLSSIQQRRDFVRIWYMQKDAYGQNRFENIECYHGFSEDRGYFIDKIVMYDETVDPEKVARFNTSLNAILAYPPDLTYPVRIRDALGKIQIQTYLFRKPVI